MVRANHALSNSALVVIFKQQLNTSFVCGEIGEKLCILVEKAI